jgi:L-threonylcarbamoyladenylate synthase
MSKLVLSAEREETLGTAVESLIKGGIIACPTETFYGLCARYDDNSALMKIYELKRRPEYKAMPLIIGSVDQLPIVTEDINEIARKLMARFWPGPLTLLFTARKGLSQFITFNGKIAIRIPGESFALKLAKAAGMPITSTSANISGMPPTTNAAMVARYFGKGPDIIVDGGESGGGKPSTIIDVTGRKYKIIREGAISHSDIKAAK